MNCLIIEDDPSMRLILKSLIEEISYLDLKGSCGTFKEAFQQVEREKIDLIFLDIEMPQMNGIEFLDSMKEKPLVIICSSKRDYAVEAFEHQTVDYMVKPITEDRFLIAVNKAKSLFDSQQYFYNKTDDYIFIKDKSALTKIKYSDILFVQAMGDYMKIITKDRWYVLHSTMRALEDILPNDIFFRTHRSYIININCINKIVDNIAYINENRIVIGDQYKQTLLKKINFI